MSQYSQSDRHDASWLIGEAVPGEAAMVEDLVVGFEDAVGPPVVAHELPDVLDGIALGAFGRVRQQVDVAENDQGPGDAAAQAILGLFREHQDCFAAELRQFALVASVDRMRNAHYKAQKC